MLRLLACWLSVNSGALPATGNGIVAYVAKPRPARTVMCALAKANRIAVHRAVTIGPRVEQCGGSPRAPEGARNHG
eukprot:12523574-Alexandrium_andersonii.AAC.1